jgi:hypothetical protein
MWDTANLNLWPIGLFGNLVDRFAVSHISRKTSEIWGTRVRGREKFLISSSHTPSKSTEG